MGYRDIKYCLKAGKKNSALLNNKPKFIQGNISNLSDLLKEDMKFDIVLDIFSSQFLSTQEVKKYLKSLQNFVMNGKTLYVLSHTTKSFKTSPEWVKKVARSKKKIESLYGKYFNTIDVFTKDISHPSKTSTFVFLSKNA